MKNNIDNPIVDAVQKLLDEQTLLTESAIQAAPGMVALNYIDITDPDNPRVVFRGAGSMPYAMRHKDIARRLQELAEDVAAARLSIANILSVFSNKKGGTGNLTFYYMMGYAEAEQLMSLPVTKAKISKAKKAKKQGN